MEQSVPKRRHIKFRRREITQKKAQNKSCLIGMYSIEQKLHVCLVMQALCVVHEAVNWILVIIMYISLCLRMAMTLLGRSIAGPNTAKDCVLSQACIRETNRVEMGQFPSKCFGFLLCTLTLNTLTWRIWWAPNNASRWKMGFNSALKGLIHKCSILHLNP